VVAFLSVYFSQGLFMTDGSTNGCAVVQMNYYIPAVAALLDMFLRVGFFYLFYKPLKDMLSVVNSDARKLDSSGGKEGQYAYCREQKLRGKLLLAADNIFYHSSFSAGKHSAKERWHLPVCLYFRLLGYFVLHN
jgi:hypothetical protein